MFLVLCSSSDVSALWAYDGLRSMELAPLFLMTGEMLSSAVAWEHRVGNGGTSLSLTLGGYGISDHTLQGVLNRLPGPPREILQQVEPADRDYALQELNAFYLSWLNSLRCPVLNPATPQGLSGRWFHVSELVMLAHQAGLATSTYRQGGGGPPDAGFRSLAPADAPLKRVIMLGDEAFGDQAPHEIRERCRNLAKLCQTPLLGIDFYEASGQPWTFAYATPAPDLQIGGARLLQGLAQLLQKGEMQ